MTKMLHRVATKASTELTAQQIISAMKTPPVCDSSTLVKKKHFVVLFVSILSMVSVQKSTKNDSAKNFTSRRYLLPENVCENTDIKFQMS